jgi:hypothetical protein
MRGTPVFCATFKDGETVRMATHCTRERLDWERGRNLAGHAWQTRDRRQRIEKFLANHDRYEHRHEMEKFLASLEDCEPPEIAAAHFDVDGRIVQESREGAPGQ